MEELIALYSQFKEKKGKFDVLQTIDTKTGKPKRNVALHKKNEARFSDEVFEVDKVLLGHPTMYKLYSKDNSIEILGKFYERELSHVVEDKS